MDHDQTAQRFVAAILAQRSTFVANSALNVVMALVAIPLVGAVAAASWLAGAITLRLLISVVLPTDRYQQLGTSVGGRGLLLASMVLEAAAYAGFAMLVAAVPHATATVVSVVMLAGSMTAIVVASRGVRALFIALSAPCAAALILFVPLITFLKGSGRGEALVLSAAGVVLYGAGAMMWVRFAKLLAAEAEARAQIETTMAGKSAFLATVSHELRTPISAMQAGALALERSAVDAAQRSNAALIVESGRMMRKLLDDLLDLAKLEAHRMTVEAVAFNARKTIRSTMLFWRPEARKKGLRLRLTGAHRAPGWVEGDPIRLRQILNNLLSNALKFTDVGSVTLEVSPAADGVTLRVIDTGPGLTEAQQQKLFEAFVQADASVSGAHGGTGLGLAISRDLANLMGGALTLTSQVGVGTTLALTLPLPKVAAPPATASVEAPSERPLKVLAADDHEINRKAITLLLDGFDIDLVLVEDGQQALEVLKREDFDVVLLDVNMPGLTGYEVARRVRAAPGPNQKTPLIGVTGAVEAGDIARCLDSGMVSVVAKPIEPAALLSAISEAVAQDPPARDQRRVA